MAISWSLNCVQKNSLFGPPSALTTRRPWENLDTFCILRTCSSYFETTSKISATMVISELLNVTWRNATTLLCRSRYATTLLSRSRRQKDACCIVVACWLLATCIVGVSWKTRRHWWTENLKQGYVSVSERLGYQYCSGSAGTTSWLRPKRTESMHILGISHTTPEGSSISHYCVILSKIHTIHRHHTFRTSYSTTTWYNT